MASESAGETDSDSESGQAACELVAVGGGVACVAGSEVVVELLHPTLFGEPARYRERRGGATPAGPVELQGVYYYGVKHDLLRFNPDLRRVDERVRFPATIAGVEVDGEALKITLIDPMSRAGGEVVRYVPGADVGRGFWDWSQTMGIVHDVMWLEGAELLFEPGATTRLPEVDEASERSFVETLEQRVAVDGANPFLVLYRAESLERLGQTEEADAAYREAAEFEGAEWLDLLRISMRLEYRGQVESAQVAFERSQEKIEARGVRSEFVTAMINMTFGLIWFRDAMEQAIATGDAESAQRLAGRLAEVFPNLEGSAAAWLRLAAFLDESGETQAAENWRQTAEERRSQVSPDLFFEEGAEAVDVYLIVQMGLFLAALFVGVILGVRRRKSWTDLTMVFVLFGGLVLWPLFVLPQASAALQNMATMAQAPPAVTGDALEAPAAREWLQQLAESPARDALLGEAAQESGVDINALLVEAVRADTTQRAPGQFSEIEASPGVISDFDWLAPLVELKFSWLFLGGVLFMLVINLTIFSRLLQIVSRRIDKVGELGRLIVPGGPNSLRALRIPVFTAFVVGLLMASPLSQAVRGATESSLVGYFGLSEAPQQLVTSTPRTGLILLAAALIAHGVGVVLDRRSVSE